MNDRCPDFLAAINRSRKSITIWSRGRKSITTRSCGSHSCCACIARLRSPCDTIELRATSWNFSLCWHIMKVCVLIGNFLDTVDRGRRSWTWATFSNWIFSVGNKLYAVVSMLMSTKSCDWSVADFSVAASSVSTQGQSKPGFTVSLPLMLK